MSFSKSLTPLGLALLIAPTQVSALDIVIDPSAALSGNAPALAAFNRAAEQWEAVFTDDILVTVTGDLSSFGSGSENVIGSTGSFFLQDAHDNIVGQIQAEGAATNPILNFLPTSAQFNANLSPGDSITGNITGTKANLKALGYGGLDGIFGVSDGTISFNSDFTFDYDNSDGITGGTMDFETVALHEIGHLLGFTSVVDQFDGATGSANLMVLDLFRFDSANLPTTTAEFTSFSRELSPGTAASFTDLNTTVEMSTGRTEGDGNQASHWKDNLGLGIMDPTLAFGELVPIGANDILAFDLIGWDIAVPVPEPTSSLLLLGAAAAGIMLRRRK